MKDTPPSRSSLAFLLGPAGTKKLVMTRSYGAITSVILTDGDNSIHSVLRIPSKKTTEFLEPYADGVIAPELSDEYDKIQLYVSATDNPQPGPLTTARAAYAMKHHGLSDAEAFAFAEEEAVALTTQQAERNKLLEDLGLTNKG